MTMTAFGEDEIEAALIVAGIRYVRTSGRLDFYLPDLLTFIEVKSAHSERAAEQLLLAEDIILVQGRKAIVAFCGMLRGKNPRTHPDA